MPSKPPIATHARRDDSKRRAATKQAIESAANGMSPNNASRNRLWPSANCRRRMSAIEVTGLMWPTNISRQKMIREGVTSPIARKTKDHLRACLVFVFTGNALSRLTVLLSSVQPNSARHWKRLNAAGGQSAFKLAACQSVPLSHSETSVA